MSGAGEKARAAVEAAVDVMQGRTRPGEWLIRREMAVKALAEMIGELALRVPHGCVMVWLPRSAAMLGERALQEWASRHEIFVPCCQVVLRVLPRRFRIDPVEQTAPH